MKRQPNSRSSKIRIVLLIIIIVGSPFITIGIYNYLNINSAAGLIPGGEAGVVASLVQATIAAVGAIFIVYQLRKEVEVEKQRREIEEAKFIFDLNNSIINNPDIREVERHLGDRLSNILHDPFLVNDIDVDGRFTDAHHKIVTYLECLEGLAPLVFNKILTIERMDNLMEYRFFIAVNNPHVQVFHLKVFPTYYRGCFKLYRVWKKYRKQKGLDILYDDTKIHDETPLDEWEHFAYYANEDIVIKSLDEDDNWKPYAKIINTTNGYFYTPKNKGIRKVKKVISGKETETFYYKNLRIAYLDGKAVGVIVVKNDNDSVHIVNLYVHKKYRCKFKTIEDCENKCNCKKIHKLLLSHVINEFSCNKIVLKVPIDNEIEKVLFRYKFVYNKNTNSMFNSMERLGELPYATQAKGGTLMKRLESTPKMDGFRMPGEFEQHEGCWILWPERPDHWRMGAKMAQAAFAKVIETISLFEPVTVGVSARQFNNAVATLPSHVRVVEMSYNDAWVRDSGPTFVKNEKGVVRGIDWKFNAYGGQTYGTYFPWDQDDRVAHKICEIERKDVYRVADFVMEGGSIHTDGEGTLFTTEECLLRSKGRNPGLTKTEVENYLIEYLGIEKVIWLNRGIYNDLTNGHVDNILAVVKPGTVLLAWTDDQTDPQYEICLENLKILQESTDAKNREFEIIKLMLPKPTFITAEERKGLDYNEGAYVFKDGDKMSASYINFYIANGGIIFPTFNDTNDKLAEETLKKAFPNRKIIGIYSREILLGGGNIHCITQQLPK